MIQVTIEVQIALKMRVDNIKKNKRKQIYKSNLKNHTFKNKNP